mmetsp:Transcript_23271/g.64997  ORF Transcript_23271/g.64997 Transcript_23271/m.64997 type:complete len:238 (+) Transcript_23271:130-843(+)
MAFIETTLPFRKPPSSLVRRYCGNPVAVSCQYPLHLVLLGITFHVAESARVFPVIDVIVPVPHEKRHEAKNSTSTMFEVTNVLRQSAGANCAALGHVDPEEGVLEDGYLGCAMGCQCFWMQQCYPFEVSVAWAAHGREAGPTNVGSCALSVSSLTVIATLLFFSVLCTVVIFRAALIHCGDGPAAGQYTMPPAPSLPVAATRSRPLVPKKGFRPAEDDTSSPDNLKRTQLKSAQSET